MDYSHEVLTALRLREKLVTVAGPKQNRAKQIEHFSWLAGLIESAQKFDFTRIQKTFDKELFVTASEALWHGLLTVPFSPSIFNFDVPNENVVAYVIVAQSEKDTLETIPEGMRHDVETIWAYPLLKVTAPTGILNPGDWLIQGCKIMIQKDPEVDDQIIIAPLIFPDLVKPDFNKNEFTGSSTKVTEFVLQALVCLAAKGIKLETSTPSRVINRIRKDKGKSPMSEHKIVVIDPNHIVLEPAENGGVHASPRLHWRRGHIRTLPSGKKTQVRACIVGDPAAGWVTHDYKVVGAAESH